MPFKINKPLINVNDTIHYLVTRPAESVVDDGKGNYNISPIGFPNVNVSAVLGIAPTRVTPEFIATYKDVITGGGFSVSYIANAPISIISGIQTITIELNQVTSTTGTATATSLYKHGYVNGATVTISGSSNSQYNTTAIVTVVDEYTFTYNVVGTPVSPANGTIKASYTLVNDSVIQLVSQDNPKNNGYYVVQENVWRVLYLISNEAFDIKSNIYSNIDISSAVAPLVTFDIASISSEVTGTTYNSAVAVTSVAHGFSSGSVITVSGSSVGAYNGTHTIDVVNPYTFRYFINAIYPSDLTTLANVSYQTSTGDLVSLTAQTTVDEIGIYRIQSGSQWELVGVFYKYNGTENDNVEGDYGILTDSKGNQLTHYRNGYSLKETADFLRNKLNHSIEFGQFKGKSSKTHEQGKLIQWLLNDREVNLGDGGSKEVYVDGFGLGNKNVTSRANRSQGIVDLRDMDAVNEQRENVARFKKTALWGLTNHHSRSMEGYPDKSPYVKDYPFIYNSEYNEEDLVNEFNGGHVDSSVDVERLRISATGTTSTTDTNIRPIAVDTLWYHRDNAYHNNITLDMNDKNVYGKHTISLINNFDTPDYVGVYSDIFTSDNITIGSSTYIELDDVSELRAGDYIRFIFPAGSTKPDGLNSNVTYKIANGYPSANSIKIVNMSDADVVTTTTGSGTFTIQRVAFDLYTNNEVKLALNSLSSITLTTGSILCKKVVSGVLSKYYISPRKKNSLSSIAPKGSWSASTLSYEAAGANGIKIYLTSLEADYVTFTHTSKTTNELLVDLNDNNDLIPLPFNSTVDPVYLTELFVSNSLIDSTNVINKTEKIRSKKTFIHLPTALDLPDGTPIEIDISLPTVPYTDSFAFNTVGCLSGYKNYVTQPRAYVFGGYHDIKCDLIPITSIVRSTDKALVTTTNNHGLFTVTVSNSDINVTTDEISPTNWADISVGDLITFKSTITLPTTSPQIAENTKYKVTSNSDGKIKISTISNTPINIISLGSGILKATICKSVYINIKGSTAIEYNNEFTGVIDSINTISIDVDYAFNSIVNNVGLFISKVSMVHGTDGIYGLTERHNSAVFGAMPEVEYASGDNIYHQAYTPDNISGSIYNDVDGTVKVDKRVLLATVYPTSTSTFQWRLDRDPQLSIIQWSMLNVNAGGGSSTTGSFANVAYNRNKAIFNEFALLYKNGSNGLFSVYSNPLSYVSTLSPSFTQQQINALVKVRFPETIGSMLDDVDFTTVGSFNYQASVAYIDLIRDFITARIKVNEVRNANDYSYILTETPDLILSEDGTSNLITEYGQIDPNITVPPVLSYVTSLPQNHTATNIPSSFYDQTSGHEFLVFDSVVLPNSSAYDMYADYRWDTKELYLASFIYNTIGDSNLYTSDPYMGMPSTLTDYLESTYFKPNKYESDASYSYLGGHDSFAFGYASSNKFIEFIKDTASVAEINDVKRRLWDSAYTIPNARQRQLQNAYNIRDNGASVEDTIKFHGSNWIPFAKIFSTDGVSPVNANITDITDYATIIGGSYGNINATLNATLKSNPIAVKFKNNGYADAFVSINSSESTYANEEFIRNYVAGYSNKLPLRFYNGFKILVSGTSDSTEYDINLGNPVVNTEMDSERIFRYSVRDYLNEYPDAPDIATYMDDNFLIYNNQGLTSLNSLYEGIENNKVSDNNGTSELILCQWETLDDWVSGTGQLWKPAGTGYIADGNLYSNINQNPFYRYIIPVSDTFIVESFITPVDDQSLYFTSSRSRDDMINWFTVRELSYFGIIFEQTPAVGPSNQMQTVTRKDDSPIMYDYDMTNSYERIFIHVDEYTITSIATYVPGTEYRILFARRTTNQFMVKVFIADTNELICEHSVEVKFPNCDGYTTDDLSLWLCSGRYGGYFSNQALAINITPSQVDDIFGLSTTSDLVTVRDPNPSWWYFDNANPDIDSVNSTIKSAISVSGMNYMAEREFYLNKMQFSYTRIKMSFVFSRELGRWLALDYRQAPTSYLTPTFGSTALSQQEKSIVYTGKSGKNITDYVPIEYTVDGTVVNTISNGTYPIDSSGHENTDYLWKNMICTDSNDAYKQLSHIGYWEMIPMELNKFCYPFLSEELPYDSTGKLVPEMIHTADVAGADIYRFTRLLEPNKEAPVGINFVVPNDIDGGNITPNNDLFMYQPHLWQVYWHMRPAVCSMDGTDIPTSASRTGGVMADPFLNNIFTYPNPRDPQFYIPWHTAMDTDWLNAGWLVVDARINDPINNPARDEYMEFES